MVKVNKCHPYLHTTVVFNCMYTNGCFYLKAYFDYFYDGVKENKANDKGNILKILI